ncbi:hypothetical protein WOLCODRAFT_147560 [Wolfiporia cocos MD-104 SS10]|uniref:Endonuclease/exonuclease/phosphatase domain-containing protein n=1 Tax=Wolfiporia cocos (strain MD-104) TaxID=742152 RepID=A0A2H3IVK9_WOLCO|nr:hypothetical protein WOLCODRAFT_147560 [Wolfiporia cocos MD-104 SS10]
MAGFEMGSQRTPRAATGLGQHQAIHRPSLNPVGPHILPTRRTGKPAGPPLHYAHQWHPIEDWVSCAERLKSNPTVYAAFWQVVALVRWTLPNALGIVATWAWSAATAQPTPLPSHSAMRTPDQPNLGCVPHPPVRAVGLLPAHTAHEDDWGDALGNLPGVPSPPGAPLHPVESRTEPGPSVAPPRPSAPAHPPSPICQPSTTPDMGAQTAPTAPPQHARPRKRRWNTRASIQLATLNMRDRGTTHQPLHDAHQSTLDKWNMIYHLVREQRIGILALQETHTLTPNFLDNLDHMYGRRLRVIHSPDPTNSAVHRVAFILNQEITNVCDIMSRTLVPGRALLLSIKWHGEDTLHILNVYAPNSPTSNQAFWNDLQEFWSGEAPDLP